MMEERVRPPPPPLLDDSPARLARPPAPPWRVLVRGRKGCIISQRGPAREKGYTTMVADDDGKVWEERW